MKARFSFKRIAGILVFAALLLLALYLLQKLLVPKYIGDAREGNLISEYYASPKDHDVIFIGDSDVYHSFSPVVLWEDYGISSYIRGSAAQTVAQSYYLLEDTLTYETPKVVVFNVFAMQTDTNNEAYNRMTLDGMKWSSSKSKAIRASMTADETYVSYLFPILRFHDRWEELTAEDIKYIFNRPQISTNGFLERSEVVPVTTLPEPATFHDLDFSSTNYHYLDMMAELCKENGIELILIKAPALYPYWYDEWEQKMSDYAGANGLTYLNFLNEGIFEQTGLDFSTDTCDGGLHLNYSGAEKITLFFGSILRKEHGVPDRSDDVEMFDSYMRLAEADRSTLLGVTPVPTGASEAVLRPTDAVPETPTPSTAPVASVPEVGKGYCFTFEGVDIYTDIDCDKLLEFISEPVSMFTAPSCGAQGDSFIYTFDSFQIETYPEGDKNRIAYITLMDDTVSTPEGVDLSYSREDIISVYGQPDVSEDSRLLYHKEGMALNFGFRGDTIIEIRYISGTFL